MADEIIKADSVKPAAPVSKIDAAAEKAYAEAAAKVVEAPKATGKAPVVKAAAKKATPAKKVAAAKKVAVKKVATKQAAPKKAAAAKKPAPAKAAAPVAKAAAVLATPVTTITKLKDTIMATAKNTDFTATAKTVAADVQTRVKGAYAKTAEVAAEVTEFNKANVDAVVESGKIFFAGAQELVKDNVETGKTVIETVTADAKKLMEVKSPTELMQMQGELARRNFDAIVSFGSKRTEAWVKLYNEAFAPISNRVSIATEKLTKAA
ncbi:phasin family protein [Erythrobacter sp. T5W1-R]|uniref:phasin family protein n=1 Tax=Erythrobacter sp. T5W1-R TaxID=3101752 RepID=UPI002AFFAD85|nr:phasin family protein [Erythrobacter sp. T5W1-R]MEA1618284.1 phasin family protein [Erythrobacter sp. T5W1-R]